ncbi:MAG: cell division protein FtsZ, partial [Roseococcus sp.]|nr:cell division protein FtsZ [Roseococcus sp.]
GLLRQPAAAAGAATALAAAPPVAQAQPYVEEMPQPVVVQPVAQPAAPPPVAYQPPLTQQALPETAPAGQGAGWRGLFRNATGLMRRNVEETPAAPPQRAEPVASQQPRAPQPMRPAQPQPDEMGLDIPTFLRRQSN